MLLGALFKPVIHNRRITFFKALLIVKCLHRPSLFFLRIKVNNPQALSQTTNLLRSSAATLGPLLHSYKSHWAKIWGKFSSYTEMCALQEWLLLKSLLSFCVKKRKTRTGIVSLFFFSGYKINICLWQKTWKTQIWRRKLFLLSLISLSRYNL